MLSKRFVVALVLALSCTLGAAQLALATKGADKSMTSSVLSQGDKMADSFEDIAKAWKKAAPGSPEAEALAKKGAEAYAELEAYVNQQLPIFEERRAWYAAQGGEYLEGRDFMISKTKRLQRLLENAQKLDLYKQLKQ